MTYCFVILNVNFYSSDCHEFSNGIHHPWCRAVFRFDLISGCLSVLDDSVSLICFLRLVDLEMSHQEHPECVSVLPSPVLLYHPLSLQVKRWACSLPSHSKASLESVQQRVSSITAHKSTDTFTLQSLSQWNLIIPVIYINIINMMVTLQFASSMKVNAKSSSCFIISTGFELFWRQKKLKAFLI